ncbi:CBL-interacting serine/threonine-protein kinase 3 [Coniothyrium glycines]
MALKHMLVCFAHLSFTACIVACSFRPLSECSAHQLAPFIQHDPELNPRISCCQAPEDSVCDHVSLLDLSADLNPSVIESGTMGTVFKASHPITSEIFAVKAFHPAAGESFPHFASAIQHEFSVSTTLANHPAFARSYALLTDAQSLQIYLIMEQVPLGLLDLLDHAQWTHNDKHCLFSQVLQAVLALHDAGIAHRDLKPGNILLSAAGYVKLIDFGEAVFLRDGNATSFTGTPPYIAPEVYEGNAHGYDAAAADLWSLGMLLLRLHAQDDPWDDSFLENEQFSAYVDDPHALLDDLDLDAEIEQAIRVLLHMSPSVRYEIRELWGNKVGNASLCAVDDGGGLHLPMEYV